MTCLKKRYWILFIILLITMATGVYGWHVWQSFKQQQGISIDWQGVGISVEGISLDELTLTKQSEFSITSKNVLISWSALSVASMDIDWQSKKVDPLTDDQRDEPQINEAGFDSSVFTTIHYWLPQQVHINSLRLYEQDNELLNLKIDLTKQQQTLQLVITNDKYLAQLSANLAFNDIDSRIDIQAGLLTTTVNQSNMTKGVLTIPFTGWITSDQFSLKSADNTSISAEKIIVSPDLLLTNVAGKANFQIESTRPFDAKHMVLNTQLTIDKLNGIYDQSEIQSLTGNAIINAKDGQLHVRVPMLSIKQIGVGIDVQNVKLAGSYFASFDSLAQGILTWNQAQATVFSGSVMFEKNRLNLAKWPQSVTVRLKGIQLNDILTAYPTEGLTGEGTIDGFLPITLSMVKKGSSSRLQPIIKNGLLTTINTGYLQFENAAMKGYAQNNPNMKIVTDVLNNFHYTKLTGDVNYQNEIAKLGLTIQGRNPDVENGKAINLNITLEENIPKLMMSLQLSDQISEPIRKRIEDRLK